MKYLYLLTLLTSFYTFGAELKSELFHLQYSEKDWEDVSEINHKSSNISQEVDQAMAEKTLGILQKKKMDEKYRSRFSVVMDPLAKKEKLNSLVQYEKHVVDFLKGQRFSILTQEKKNLPNLATEGIIVTANQRDFGLTFKQLIFIKNSNAFILTGTTRTNQFQASEKEIDAIMDSFRFN